MIDTIEYQKKKCQWERRSEGVSNPHVSVTGNKPKKIYNDCIEMIGNTPVVRLNKIPQSEGIKCEIVAKLEFFNPGGSLKDRVGKRTVHDLQQRRLIKPGYTLIEATSGNCGIGLAMLSAVEGFKAIITMPDKMSLEKKYILNSMGAECIRTPSDAPFNSPDSLLGVAFKLNKEINTSRFLDQYSDDSNSLVNYDETAEELWDDLDGKVDYVVMSVGTGGTLTGIARKFKERNPNVIIVGVDPVGSSLAYPPSLNNKKCPFKVEGIGYDFVPKNLDQKSVDIWYKCEDIDSFLMARRIIREEGLLVGGSSGTATWAAIKLAKDLDIPSGKRICVIFCDGIRNYMSKYVSNEWMIDYEYFKEEDVESKDNFKLNKIFGQSHLISSLLEMMKLEKSKFVTENDSIVYTANVMDMNSVDYLPVFSADMKILIGITSMEIITQKILSGYIKSSESIKRAMSPEFKKLTSDEPVSRISKAFKTQNFVVVKDIKNENIDYYSVFPCDLIEFIRKIESKTDDK